MPSFSDTLRKQILQAEQLRKAVGGHISEVYDTLTDNEGIHNYLQHVGDQAKKALPILAHDPQNVSMNDIINSGFGVMPLSTGKLPPTAFSNAHDVAQKNAVEMLGLPPNNTAMDRAKAMGFDIEKPSYHGTNNDITEFNNSYSSPSAAFGNGVYVSDNPIDAGNWAKMSENSNVMPLLLNKSDYLERFAPISERSVDKLNNFLGREINPEAIPYFSLENRSGSVSKGAENAGFSGVEHFGPGKSYHHTVITDPTTIRSRFAAFDPAKKNSANILASMLLGATIIRNRSNKDAINIRNK